MDGKNIFQDNIIFNAISTGTPFKDILPDGMEEVMENFYKLAVSLYDDEEYEKAVSIFGLLGLLDYTDSRYSMGVGACAQCLHRYEHAIFSYTHASMADTEDPKAAFHGGECALAIGDIKAALDFFTFASKATKKDEQSKMYRKQATSLLKQLKKDYFND